MAAPVPTDPRNAQYFQTKAALEHQEATTLADNAARLSNAETGANYQQGLLAQKEPLSYKANQHRANAGGVLESGVNAERRGTIGAEYSNRRGAINNALQQTRDSVSRSNQAAREGRERGEGQAAINAEREAEERTLKNPTNELGPANPGGVKTITGPEEAGGVVPYHETSKAGSVTVGGALNARRRAAIQRMTKMGVG